MKFLRVKKVISVLIFTVLFVLFTYYSPTYNENLRFGHIMLIATAWSFVIMIFAWQNYRLKLEKLEKNTVNGGK